MMNHGPHPMHWLGILMGLALPMAVHAQPATMPHARLFLITPCGGQLGQTVRVTVSGIDLEEARALHFSHPGLVATLAPDPAKPGQYLPNQFDVVIAQNTPLGAHDVRVIGKYGISNPRVFMVGDLPEVAEKEPNNDLPQAQLIEIGCTIQGSINPNVDVDYFQFDAKKGQSIQFLCQGSSLDSLFEPELRLLNAAGKMLAIQRAVENGDLALDFTYPEDGRYFLRLCQFGHVFGSPNHYYRLTIRSGPWIEAAYPPVIQRGAVGNITLWGRRLPGGQPDAELAAVQPPLERVSLLLASPPEASLPHRLYSHSMTPTRHALFDGFDYRLQTPGGWSNGIYLATSPYPVVLQQAGNAAPDKAQVVTLPCEVAARFTTTGEKHWYRFTGKAGQVVVIEGFADRHGAPLDLYFEVRRADNQQVLGEFDDHPEAYAPLRFFARTEDPKARLGLPADGDYEIMVGARNQIKPHLPRCIYRLSLQPDQPDFRIAVLDEHIQSPGAWQLPRGSHRHVEVYVFRQNAFAGPILLSAEDLPPGVTCTKQIVNPGAPQAVLVLSAAADAPAFDGPIRIKGTALINGQEVTRWARGGCIVWPNPAEPNGVPARSRLTREICLSVREPAPYRVEPDVREVGVPAGGTIPLKLRLYRQAPEANVPVTITVLNMPINAVFNGNNAPVAIAANVQEAAINIQIPANVPPGEYSLALLASANVPFNKDPKNAQKPAVLVREAMIPIKITVFPKIAEAHRSSDLMVMQPLFDHEIVNAALALKTDGNPLDFVDAPRSHRRSTRKGHPISLSLRMKAKEA